MNTYTCGFCGAQVPIDNDEGHVGGACVPQEKEGIPIDVETANELIRLGVIKKE